MELRPMIQAFIPTLDSPLGIFSRHVRHDERPVLAASTCNAKEVVDNLTEDIGDLAAGAADVDCRRSDTLCTRSSVSASDCALYSSSEESGEKSLSCRSSRITA